MEKEALEQLQLITTYQTYYSPSKEEIKGCEEADPKTLPDRIKSRCREYNRKTEDLILI